MVKSMNRTIRDIIPFVCAGGIAYGAQETDLMKDISFTAQCDGTTQKYVLIFPDDFAEDEPHDVLIALHGHGADRWQFAKDGRDECRAARDFAAGYDMLYVSPDYRATTSWMGPKAEADVVQIISDLKRTYSVSRVFICGGSMGGTATLAFAAMHPELVAGAAAMNGTANFLEYENFQDAICASFGGDKKQIPFEYKKRSAEYWPEKLTMPVGLTASGKDTSVPPGSVMRLAKVLEAMGGRVLLIYREQLGHLTKYADAMAVLDYMLTGEQDAGQAETNVVNHEERK